MKLWKKINIWQAISNKTLDARNLPVLAWSYENVDFSIDNYYPNVKFSNKYTRYVCQY